MKELDFLPEWYKDRKRRSSLVRKQYIALAGVFLLMMMFNLTATHRAGRVAADVSRYDDQLAEAETVVYEFAQVTKELNQMKAKAEVVSRVDNQIDVGAILAEISQLVGESTVLSKIELVAEPFERTQAVGPGKGAPSRAASATENVQQDLPLGNSRLRVTLAGLTTQSSQVADLVCRLDESAYFQQVLPSFYGKTKIPSGASPGVSRQADKARVAGPDTQDVTAFEITCYLANYKEIEGQ
ncbi:MAG: hypothetical protein ACM3VT_18505 [Solirubrobacterales bacterium]